MTCVTDVDFVVHFLSGKFYLLAINDDYIVATINIWSEVSFVLTTKYFRDLATNSSQYLIFCIYNYPVLLNCGLRCVFCFVG